MSQLQDHDIASPALIKQETSPLSLFSPASNSSTLSLFSLQYIPLFSSPAWASPNNLPAPDHREAPARIAPAAGGISPLLLPSPEISLDTPMEDFMLNFSPDGTVTRFHAESGSSSFLVVNDDSDDDSDEEFYSVTNSSSDEHYSSTTNDSSEEAADEYTAAAAAADFSTSDLLGMEYNGSSGMVFADEEMEDEDDEDEGCCEYGWRKGVCGCFGVCGNLKLRGGKDWDGF
ncbi:MAG: hypothetical protein Q9220_006066 [cf. Caloplaca sp. 1 TL-2023]